MLLHNFFHICYRYGLAVCKHAKKEKNPIDRHRAELFFHSLGPVVKFNEVICLLCFYYCGAFICCVEEYLEIPI